MLQTEKTPSALDRDFGPSEIASLSETFHNYVRFIQRQKPIIIFVLLLAIIMGAVYLFTAPPRFTGEARMIIDSRKVQLFQNSLLSEVALSSAAVESQV